MKEAKRKKFTGYDLEGIPLDVLKNSYFFISDNLKLDRVSNSQIAADGASKGIVVSRKVKEEVLISKDTKGKLLEVRNIFEIGTGRILGKELLVQFDSDRNCFLVFAVFNKANSFTLQKKTAGSRNNMSTNTILYNGEKYEASTYRKCHDGSISSHTNHLSGVISDIILEFQLRETTETVTTEAQGAW